MSLTRAGIHPLGVHRGSDGAVPSPWARKQWSVFINDEEQLACAIEYVERHPIKEGLPAQSWNFLKNKR